MTLPAYPNIITMAQVNTELGRASNAAINLNETAVRTLAGVPSGIITMHDLHGKSAVTLAFNNANALFLYNGDVYNAGGFSLTSYGVISAIVNRVDGPSTYLSPTGAGNGANYEALIYHSTSTGGRSMYAAGAAVSPGNYSAWLSLDADKTFSGASEENYEVYSYGTLIIRKKDLSASISVNFTIKSYRMPPPPQS